jgi:hypothetical protein
LEVVWLLGSVVIVRAGSELKARFPGGIGKSFHPAVVQVAASIEDNLLNAFGNGTFGH